MYKKTLLLCLLCAGMMWTLSAVAATESHANVAVAGPDDQEITGTVEDADGPMIGATVKVLLTKSVSVADF